LTEFGKAIGKGQGQEAGPTFRKSVFGRKPISLATVGIDEMMAGC
jgi:hypothetical protein